MPRSRVLMDLLTHGDVRYISQHDRSRRVRARPPSYPGLLALWPYSGEAEDGERRRASATGLWLVNGSSGCAPGRRWWPHDSTRRCPCFIF